MTRISPGQGFAYAAELLDAGMRLTEAEFAEHPRTAAQTRRLDRLLKRAAEARTAALHVASLNLPCRRLELQISRVCDRLGGFATDLEFDGLLREPRQ